MYTCRIQVKITLQVKIFYPRLTLNFLYLLTLIIQELGLGEKGNENQPRLKNFNLNLVLTCNVYISHNENEFFVLESNI